MTEGRKPRRLADALTPMTWNPRDEDFETFVTYNYGKPPDDLDEIEAIVRGNRILMVDGELIIFEVLNL